MPRKRLFLALPIPQALCNSFAEYASSLSLANVRWTIPESLHITLHFLGSMQEDHISALVESLGNVISQHIAFALKFKQVCLMPQKNPSRMVWIEYYNSDAYQALFDDTKNIIMIWADKHGYRFDHNDNKALIPHITLGRCKHLFVVPDFLLPQPAVPDLIVDTVQLMESCPGLSGPVYTVLKTFLLSS